MDKNTIYAKTKKIISDFNLRVLKKYGQNFLIDINMINKIIRDSTVSYNDCVLEIGPGLGALTNGLCKIAKKVVSVEIDNDLMPVLHEVLGNYENIELINADILKLDLKKLINTYNINKVVANLPYYIAVPIIMNLLSRGEGLKSIIVMVQKEVADRFLAEPGVKDYGRISVIANYHADIEVVAKVPSECFIPRPNVNSRVIIFKIKKQKPCICDLALFEKLIKASFSQRRKTLVNCISDEFLLDKSSVMELIKSVGLKDSVRGEELGLDKFILLNSSFCDIYKYRNI